MLVFQVDVSDAGGVLPADDMPLDCLVTIDENRRLSDSAFVVTFRAPTLAAETLPGQFVMLGFPRGTDPFLRRPYSVYRVGPPGGRADRCQVLYKVVGHATARLGDMHAGEQLTCLGPLGRGFHLPPDDGSPLLVAGGIGIAGLLHLGATLQERGRRPRLLYGCGGREDLLLTQGFEDAGIPISYATEDGSRGLRGLVTTLLETELAARRAEVFACGPRPMLRAVARMTAGRSPCQVSMESHMACGFGVCLGCVVPTARGTGHDRYARVCVEGPVFRAEELSW